MWTLLSTAEISNKFLLLLNNFKRNDIAPRKSVFIINYFKEKGHTEGEVISIVGGDNIDDALVVCFYVVV